jgi:hypothetical protein
VSLNAASTAEASVVLEFNNWLYLAFLIISITSTTLGTAFWLSWWLSKQFVSTKQLVYERADSLKKFFLEKIEYHEKHDDSRFQEIRNDIWDIRVRNAARDGLIVRKRHAGTLHHEADQSNKEENTE